jgi:hypothetical protein
VLDDGRCRSRFTTHVTTPLDKAVGLMLGTAVHRLHLSECVRVGKSTGTGARSLCRRRTSKTVIGTHPRAQGRSNRSSPPRTSCMEEQLQPMGPQSPRARLEGQRLVGPSAYRDVTLT